MARTRPAVDLDSDLAHRLAEAEAASAEAKARFQEAVEHKKRLDADPRPDDPLWVVEQHQASLAVPRAAGEMVEVRARLGEVQMAVKAAKMADALQHLPPVWEERQRRAHRAEELLAELAEALESLVSIARVAASWEKEAGLPGIDHHRSLRIIATRIIRACQAIPDLALVDWPLHRDPARLDVIFAKPESS